MEFETYKEARDLYPNEQMYKIIKLGDKKYTPINLKHPDAEIHMEGGKSDFFNKKISDSRSLYGDIYESVGENERKRYLVTKTGDVKLISGEPVISKKDLKDGTTYSTIFRNPGFTDLGNIAKEEKLNKSTTKRNLPPPTEPLQDLTFGQTYALPPEYVNALAQMSLGKKGNNQFKRQVIAGNDQALGGALGGGTTERSAGNFLGAIAQGISESVADNAQKWSSSETGKADFWNRIVPALEAATGRKITGLSLEQQQQMNAKYHELQIQKQQAGEPITDQDYQKLYRDAMVEGTRKGLQDQALQDFSANYAKQTWMKQMNEDSLRKQTYQNAVAPINQQMSNMENNAAQNTGGNTVLDTRNPDVMYQTTINNQKPLLDDKMQQMWNLWLAKNQVTVQDKKDFEDYHQAYLKERNAGGGGDAFLQNFSDLLNSKK